MKFCPTCQTRYDEEILRFCTKDGTALVEENQPAFTALPSEAADDDFGEETVIRRNAPPAAPPVVIEETKPLTKRVVIPSVEEKVVAAPPQTGVRSRTVTEYQVQPRKTNTAKIVLLTLLGTIAALGLALFFVMNRGSNPAASVNQNSANVNFNQTEANSGSNLFIGNSTANFNSNIGVNQISNANINANFNVNSNTNINANIKTPTPKPTVAPTASPRVILNTNINVTNSNASGTPTPEAETPTATPTPPPAPASSPRPTPSATPANRPVNAGVLNGRAVSLPKPAYPPIARQMRAAGQVAVQIAVDEAGNVTAARATSGNALLRAPAEAAARQSKINPVKVGDRSVQAVGILLYNFTNP